MDPYPIFSPTHASFPGGQVCQVSPPPGPLSHHSQCFLSLACSSPQYFYGWGFPGGSVVKNPPANAGDAGLIPGSGRSPGEGNGSPLEHCCLESPMDGGAWGAAYGPGLAASDATEQRQLCPRGWTLQLFHIFTQTSFSQPGLFCPSCLKYSSAHVAFSVLFPDLGFSSVLLVVYFVTSVWARTSICCVHCYTPLT